MLTFDLLWAILQGLPVLFIDRVIGRDWVQFCLRIERARRAGLDPVSALKHALQEADRWQLRSRRAMFEKFQPILKIPGLTYRQRELLFTVSVSGPCDLPKLTMLLAQDRSHIHRRLGGLVAKGLIVKFGRQDGIFYFAPTLRLDRSQKTATFRLIMEVLGTLMKQPIQAGAESSERMATSATLATMATSATTATRPPETPLRPATGQPIPLPASREIISAQQILESSSFRNQGFSRY
jgi:hypothetical protein